MRMGIASVLVIGMVMLGLVRTSAADEPDALREFFVGERDVGALIVSSGLTAAALGTALAVQDHELSRGAGYTILAVSALQLAGGAMLVASHGRGRKMMAARAHDPIAFAASERMRMKRIDVQYKLMEALEGTMMASGVAVAAAGAAVGDKRMSGIGVGLLLQGGVMLILDMTAHHRARRYRATLQ